MHASLRLLIATLALPSLLFAQSIPSTRSNERPPAAQLMAAALALRTNVTARIANGELTPEQAINRLRQADSASGLGIDSDADLGLAVADVAQRLVVQGKLMEAEALFIETEKSLDKVVKKTADTNAREKAMYLRSLARIQERFLNKQAQAKENFAEASRLHPEDRTSMHAGDQKPRS